MASRDTGHSLHHTARSGKGKNTNPPKTPFSNRRVSLHQVRQGGRKAESLEVLKVLLKKTWSAYAVSPLFTWNSRESKLKRYSRRLSNFLAGVLPSEEGDKFEVEYRIDHDLKLGANDDPAVEISVNVSREDNLKQVFLGYLLSWGCRKSAKPDELDGVLYLPVLICLCSGSKRVGTQVRRALETIHDCVVSSLELRESDRKELWMALLSYIHKEGDADSVTISYMIPNRPSVGLIDVELSTDMTTKLSKLIHKKHGRDVTYDEVALFWSEINSFIYNIFQIKVQNCEMTRLHMRAAVMRSDKFRAITAEAMHVILTFLTNMAVRLD